MGDSSVSCAFSGLTLHGETAVFIPLAPSQYAEKLVGARLISGSSQACALFSPLTLPYRGMLDDYGYFESIDKDENTALIEAAFGMTIEQFTEACIDAEAITVNGREVPGIGCYIHAEVYDRFCKPITGGRWAGSLWRGQFAGSIHLKAVGCKLEQDLQATENDFDPDESVEDFMDRVAAAVQPERYRYIYRHPAIKGVQFQCDGTFTNTIVEATGEKLHGYGLDGIHRSLHKAGFTGFPKGDIAWAKMSSEIEAVFKAELQQWKAKRSFTKLPDLPPLLTGLFEFPYLRSMECFEKRLLWEYLKVFQGSAQLLSKAEQLFHLLWSFSYANRVLMPTIAGTQYPENAETVIITGAIDRIAKQRIHNSKK